MTGDGTRRRSSPSRLVPKIALGILSLAVTLGLCEAAARLVYPKPPVPGREPQITYVRDPELGYVHVSNAQGWIDDGWVTINSKGFRGRETQIPKPQTRFRIMTLGDSV